MSWRQRINKVYRTKDPNVIITAVWAFPNMLTTVELAAKHYGTEQLIADEKYREIITYFNLRNGYDFTVIHLADTLPKLGSLDRLKNLDKGYYWCVGYISKFWKDPDINGRSKSIDVPSFEILSDWLKYYVSNYFVKYSGIVSFLFQESIKAWVYENTPENADVHRRFDVMENKTVRFTENRELEPNDYIKFIDDLVANPPNWYQFVFEQFK